MKLKCKDGKVRRFSISYICPIMAQYVEARCEECGYKFGVADTNILRPKFKKHVCKIIESERK